MDTENGKVVKIDRGIATIQMYAGGQCNHCSAKHICSAFGGTIREIDVPLAPGVTVGDPVMIRYQARSKIGSAALLFIMPILFLMAGYALGFARFHSEGKAVITAMIGLALAFVVNWFINKSVAAGTHFVPTIVKTNP